MKNCTGGLRRCIISCKYSLFWFNEDFANRSYSNQSYVSSFSRCGGRFRCGTRANTIHHPQATLRFYKTIHKGETHPHNHARSTKNTRDDRFLLGFDWTHRWCQLRNGPVPGLACRKGTHHRHPTRDLVFRLVGHTWVSGEEKRVIGGTNCWSGATRLGVG